MITRSHAGVRWPNPRYALQLSAQVLPWNINEAKSSPEWNQALNSEIDSLKRNTTWTLVPRTPKLNVLNCKWVYRLKHDENGNVTCYKARLVANEMRQIHNINVQDTYASVIKPSTIRIVLSLAVSKGWDLRQLDVSNAFLHNVLEEDVFMNQPPSFLNKNFPTHVFHLQKSLYGLKQSPRAWFKRLHDFLLKIGFREGLYDSSLFIHDSNDTQIYLLVYVDNIVVTASSSSSIGQIIS